MLGTGSAITSCVPSAALAEGAEVERQRLWYASHCWGCGFPYCPKWLAVQHPPSAFQFCEWCRWHKRPTGRMTVPADWYPGSYEDPNAKAYL